MKPALDETPFAELTLRSVHEKIKQATDPILRRVEKLIFLLASRTKMESAGNSEASGWRRNRESSSLSRNRYYMATGVHTNSNRRNWIERATAMDNGTNYDQEQPEDDDDECDMTQLMNAIINVPTLTQRNTQKHKLLHTQVPTFKSQKERYNEFERLLLNHIRPFQNKITEEEKLQFFTSLLRKTPLKSGRQSKWHEISLSQRSNRCYVKNTLEMISTRYRHTDRISSNKTISTNLSRISSNTLRRQQNKHLVLKLMSMSMRFWPANSQ